MWKNIDLQKCLSHIQSGLDSQESGPPEIRPSITISRMCGAGGRTVASRLVDHLQPHTPFGSHWTIFDRKLIEKVLEDHSLSARLAEFAPESGGSVLVETFNRLRGNRPSTSKIVEQTVETIWKLAQGGHVILVGRAANIITARLKNVFHVRLVGSLERRIERVEEVYEMSRAGAQAYVKTQDADKKLYVKEYFGREIDDPELYHLMVNTDRIPYEDTARLIAGTFLNWRKSEFAAKTA